jgi:hypothetical protein
MKTIEGEQAGAVFVLDDTVVAYAYSAPTLDRLI